MTEQQIPCPRCRRENPPSDRFCGSCGARLTGGEQLLTKRQELRPIPAGRAWPARLGSAGKMLAVGVAALAVESGLYWLRRRTEAGGRSSLPSVRDVGPTSHGYLVGHSMEEILIQAREDSHIRAVARREILSFLATRSTDGR